MKEILEGLRDLWRDIERSPPHAPPGCEKGGGIAFIVWFGTLITLFIVLIARVQ